MVNIKKNKLRNKSVKKQTLKLKKSKKISRARNKKLIINNSKNKLLINDLMDLEGFQSIIVSKDDNIIFQYGDITYNKGYLASCRKSILAILYGMYPINLNKTLEELDIDDKIKLSKTEKSATIKDLLMARSGIYHPSNDGGDPIKPERHSKKPGEYFEYNNWDFNALGTIFEQETGINIYDSLDNLGKQIGFEDYDLEFNKKKYKDRAKDTTLSIHPPYHMYLSARDMLKIGKLMINKGEYDGKQVVPKEWIDEITYLHSHTRVEKNRKLEGGYGYMWWISDVNKDEQLHGAYSALGLHGQRIVVVPKLNLIIVTKYYLGFALLLQKILGMFS